TLAGAGRIGADGADGLGFATYYGLAISSGGGGGGRVAVYAQSLAGFDATHVSATGGLGGLYGPTGGPGTVYLKDTGQPHGTLLIDAGTRGDAWTPLGLPGSDTFAVPDALVVQGSRTRVRPEHAGLVFDFQAG